MGFRDNSIFTYNLHAEKMQSEERLQWLISRWREISENIMI